VPSRKELPPGFRLEPFSVRAAADAGLGEGRLRGADLERPFHGVRLLAGSTADTGRNYGRFATAREAEEFAMLVTRCLAYAAVLKPGQFFSHTTAARLWKAPLPSAFSATEALHVSTPAPRRAPAGRGVVGHQSSARQVRIVDRFGLPVSDPASTWLTLGVTPGLSGDDLVVVGDHLVLDPAVLDPYDIRPYATLAELAAAVGVRQARGTGASAAALPHVRAGAESRPETLLRLLLVRAGLPEPLLAQELRDAAGRWLARVDLYFPEQRVVVEYDGEGHRVDNRQYERDESRIENLISAGYTVVRVRGGQLFAHPDLVVARVSRALATRGWVA
jgi:hypothetical protein